MVTQRAVKDESEVAAIRRALRIQQDAFTALRRHMRPGQTERELAAALEYFMRELGRRWSQLSHHRGRRRQRQPSARHSGGNQSQEEWHRVDRLGREPERLLLRSHPRAGFGQDDGEDAGDLSDCAGRPTGRHCGDSPRPAAQDIDAVARKIIKDAGYGEHFGHGTGHGIGLDIHEQPTLSPRSKGVLQAGQVVTVEPGIYRPGVGGVRIEDDVLVTPEPPEPPEPPERPAATKCCRICPRTWNPPSFDPRKPLAA